MGGMLRRLSPCLPLLFLACRTLDAYSEQHAVSLSPARQSLLTAFAPPFLAGTKPNALGHKEGMVCLQQGGRCAPVQRTEQSTQLLALRMSRDGDNGVVFVPGAKKQPQRMGGSRWDQWYAPMSENSEDGEESEAGVGEGSGEEEEDEEWLQMSKLERLRVATEESLDWKVLKGALVGKAATSMGRRALEELGPLESVAEVEEAFEAAAETRLLRDQGIALPLGRVKDVRKEAASAAKGEVLELEELHGAALTLAALLEIEDLLSRRPDTPVLTDFAQEIAVEAQAVSTLARSFDATGQLSTKTYPQLAALRKQIDTMAGSVTTTMEGLLKQDALKNTLQDSFYTIRDNRFVLPVTISNKNKVAGIVHGVSATGSTVYIEPTQVIELNNRLRLAEGELRAEETRIRTLLSQRLAAQASSLRAAIHAVTRLDLARARELLAVDLAAVRPAVNTTGTLRLVAGRHPVLVLQGAASVPNDIALDEQQAALVISGPNAGGKTVALKTVGLAALLVQHGCWVPAGEGSQVDLFHTVLASIGDQQTVERGLSSFSSHLAVLDTMLRAASPGALLLLDEIASGTDPAQGAPLAQAILERLLEAGPRLVVTTHYAQLKALATVDARFGVAAMQFLNGAPSYKVLHGVTGESHALSIARKMGLDEALMQRAELLMGQQAAVTRTLEALESERARAVEEAEEAARTRLLLQARLADLEAREAVIRAKSKQLEQQGAAEFLAKLKQHEKEIAQVVKGLQQGPSFKEADRAKEHLDALRHALPSQDPSGAGGGGVEARDLKEGDRVLLLDLGSEGVVAEAPNAKGDVQVRLGAISLRTSVDKLRLLGGPAQAKPKGRKGQGAQGGGGKRGAKGGGGGPTGKKALAGAVRTPSNTLDLRGLRAEEVGEEVDKFLDNMVRAGVGTCFLLTGHGTGVVKKVVQEHLGSSVYAAAFGAASFEQGGDALTVVAIR